MDIAFLNKEPITCNAVIPASELSKLENGKKIVIQLSNGAKYMGKIIQSNFAIKNSVAIGHLTITKF